MQGKIILEVLQGELCGKSFEYTEQARVFIGRQEDCGLVLPDSTVSRYHCLLDILPPHILLQDFGSLNGTYLNDKNIGQRRRDQAWEEAKNDARQAHELHDGDILGLGKSCKLRCWIETVDVCARCGKDLSLAGKEERKEQLNEEGKPLCEACWLDLERAKEDAIRAEAERLAEELAEQFAAMKPKQPLCLECGKPFTSLGDDRVCPDCLAQRNKLLAELMQEVLSQEQPPEEKAPSLSEAFEEVECLGQGGMGEVWKVRFLKTGQCYALKKMLPKVEADPHSVEIFLREAHIAQVLRHKNVVRTYEVGDKNGRFYILMDLCKGGSVQDLLEENGGTLSLELSTWIILQLLSGLDYLHNCDIDVLIHMGIFGGEKEIAVKGVVHRDIKPGNFFLSDRSDHPRAMVADLGMAKAFSAAGLYRITKTGSIMGTPVFMPRQQAMDCKYAQPEVDVWALAASYYYMLTGTFPKNFVPGKNPWHVIISETAVPIRERKASIPQGMAEVIDTALREKPTIGYQTAAAFREALIRSLPSELKRAVEGVL